jgi:hypothetical protein
MRTQRAPVDTIQRPYVGKDALDINEVRERKSNDTSWPPKLTVEVSMAFEKMATGATPVPPAPPTPTPQRGRDPVYLVLGNYELGTRIEVVSLSDHPDADFNAASKDKIFELPLTGRDAPNRRASVALDDEQMKEKGIVPGETLLVRQVDEAGNASEPTLIYLDPTSWAQRAFNEPLATGGTQRVNGQRIDVFVGDHGVSGSINPASMVGINAKSTQDTSAPVIVDKNVSFSKQPDGQVMFKFDKAFEPGAQVQLKNLDNGVTDSWSIDVSTRTNSVTRPMVDGDRFELQVTDRAGLVTKQEFIYAEKAADGKAPIGKAHTLNPDDIRFAPLAGMDEAVTATYRQLATVVQNLTGNNSSATVLASLKTNQATWATSHPQHADAVVAAIGLLESPGFVAAYVGEKRKVMNNSNDMLNSAEIERVAQVRDATKDGATMTVKNPVPAGVKFAITLPVGPVLSFTSDVNNRNVSIPMYNLKAGDPVLINYTDRDNKLHTHTFTFDGKADGGKLKNNALQMRLAANRLTSNV